MPELKKPIKWPEVDYSGRPPLGSPLDTSWPTLYSDLRDMRRRRWMKLAKAYEAEPDFWNSWWWLQMHPIFWYFGRMMLGRPLGHESNLCWDRGVDEGLEFRPAMVDPNTRKIEEFMYRNTHLEIWVEVFPASLRQTGGGVRLHDVDCDTGGDTYEQAIVKVAAEIYNKHGHDRQVLAEEWESA